MTALTSKKKKKKQTRTPHTVSQLLLMVTVTGVRAVTQQKRWPRYRGLLGLPQNTFGHPFKTFQIGKEEPHLNRAVCRPRKLSKVCRALKGTPTCTAAQLGRWRSPAAIPPGFFSQLSHMSYMPELGNCFLEYSFCNFKNNRRKEKQWGRKRDTQDHFTKCMDTNKSAESRL